MTTKYDYNLAAFYDENDLSYYLLGAFMTDGCVYKNNKNTFACQLSSRDREWLDTIKELIGSNLRIHTFKKNYYGIRIIRNDIASWFMSHGCVPRKTLTLKMPAVPQQYMPDFLRGCIDGDGSIGTYFNKDSTKRTCCLISASKEFLDGVQKYLHLQDIKSGITEKKQGRPAIINGKPIIQKHKCYCLYTTGINCFKLLHLIYYPEHKISLARKYGLAKEIISFYKNTPITDKRHIRKLNIHCKIQWPEDNELINMINNSNVERIAIKLGIHGTAVRQRLITRGLYDQVKKNQRVVLPPDDILIPLLKESSVLAVSKRLNIGYKTLRIKLKERGLR